MVFQSYALYPHLSVFENIAFPLRVAKVNEKELEEKVFKAADILQLRDRLGFKPGQLSGGQRQRVAIGRSIVRDPKVFLFDEPLSNLDAALRGDMRVELAKLHQNLNSTMIYVTHDQIEAMTMADRIVVMRDGRVEQIGTPLDLYDTPQNVFVAGFIGSPSMNFLQGKIDGDDGKLHFLSDDGLIFPIPDAPVKSGDRVTYGIRPEHIELGENGMSFEISVLEPMGSETQIYAKSGAQKIDALVKDRLSSKPGMHVNFVINPEHVHLFDAQSENRI